MTLKAAALEARIALENGWREVIDCPHCTGGSIHHYDARGRWTKRCAFCRGVGRIYRDTLVAPIQSQRSNAEYAERAGSFPASFDRVPSVEETS
jgi:hypothetical protein